MSFAKHIISWQKQHGRHDLPWQINRTPYRVWASEIMLQQTQVATVIGYFNRFMKECPTVHKLAQLPNDKLMLLWEGLGYYSRARNLHKCAKIISTERNGTFPDTLEGLLELPGIGPSTAAAIMALAYHAPDAILDGNVKRVLCRYHGIESDPKDKETLKLLWKHAKEHAKNHDPQTYTQGIMDLGATICKPKKPICSICPVTEHCTAFKNNTTDIIPKKAKPIRKKIKNLYLAMSIKDNTTLLYQRPEKGIWGQLYTPKILETKEELLNQFEEATPLTPYTHILTHMKLNIYPFIVTQSASCGVWANLNSLNLAIPTGVKPALKQLRDFIKQTQSDQ